MKKPSHPEKSKSASQEFRDWEPADVPLAPDGGIAPGFATQGPALPILNEATTKCLRGPCRNYWEMKVEADAGNPAGTWESIGVAKPIQIIRTCLANPGHETDLGDTAVIECNRWHPIAMTVVDVQTDDEYMRLVFAGGDGFGRKDACLMVASYSEYRAIRHDLQWVGEKILLVPRRLWDENAIAQVMLGNLILMTKDVEA